MNALRNFILIALACVFHLLAGILYAHAAFPGGPVRLQAITSVTYYVNGNSIATNGSTAGGTNTLHFAAGSATTNATTAGGNNTLHFASTPGTIYPGATISDTTASVIPAATTVLSVTPTTVVLSANVTGGGVGNGDTIQWSLASFPVGATITDITASVIPNGTTISSVTPTTVVLSANVTGSGIGSGDIIAWSAICGTAGGLTCGPGSDLNNCLSPSASCRTAQHVVDYLTSSVDLALWGAQINGAHCTGAACTNYVIVCETPLVGTSVIGFTGDSTAPTAVKIIPGPGGNGVTVKDQCTFGLSNFAFRDNATNNANEFINIGLGNYGHVDIGRVDFGGCTLCIGIEATYSASVTFTDSNSSSTGGKVAEFYAHDGGVIDFGGGTFAGASSLTYSTAFADIVRNGIINATSSTFTGFSGVTGPRCSIFGPVNFVLGNPNAIFPGNSDCVVVGMQGAIGLQTGSGGSSSLNFGTAGQALLSGGALPAKAFWGNPTPANPSPTTLGGVESIVAATHQWIDSISTSGVPHQSQPACGDLSDATVACNGSVAALGAYSLQGNFATAPITVNFGVAGDNAIPVTLPTGYTQVNPVALVIAQCTGSLSGMTFGFFTTTGGGGAALVTAGATSTVANNTANTNNNYQNFNTFNNTTTLAYAPSGGNLQMRVGATASATCKVVLQYRPVP